MAVFRCFSQLMLLKLLNFNLVFVLLCAQELSEHCEETIKSRESQSSFIFTEGDPYVSLSLYESLRDKFPGGERDSALLSTTWRAYHRFRPFLRLRNFLLI